jgi:hypothetical protein
MLTAHRSYLGCDVGDVRSHLPSIMGLHDCRACASPCNGGVCSTSDLRGKGGDLNLSTSSLRRKVSAPSAVRFDPLDRYKGAFVRSSLGSCPAFGPQTRCAINYREHVQRCPRQSPSRFLIAAQRSVLTSHDRSATSRVPAGRQGYGLVESRLAHAALRLCVPRSIGSRL